MTFFKESEYGLSQSFELMRLLGDSPQIPPVSLATRLFSRILL